MNLLTICVLAGELFAVHTAAELRTLAKQVTLPARAAQLWSAIGTYTIKDEKTVITVKLYVQDSDSRAERALLGSVMYPNYFALHAVYRAGDGAWKYEQLYGAYRIGLFAVSEVKPDSITLQLQSKAMLSAAQFQQFTEEQLDQIFKPKPCQLTVKDGVPVLK